MTLIEHVRELRSRMIKAALAILLGTILAFFFYQPIFHLLEHPYCSLPQKHRPVGLDPGSCQLFFFHPLEAFAIRLRVGIIGGILVSSPVWLYQIWAFITPGLKRNERRWALSFVGASVALFAAGASMAYVTLSKALEFLLGAVGNNATAVLGVSEYLGFVTTIMTIFGLSFELPLVLVLLNLAGVLSAKRLIGWRRMAIFLLFCFAGVATPSGDPITMTVMGGGLSVLYEGAVTFARVNDRRRARKEAAVWAALQSDDPASALMGGGGQPAT